jgi:hypothetical protein
LKPKKESNNFKRSPLAPDVHEGENERIPKKSDRKDGGEEQDAAIHHNAEPEKVSIGFFIKDISFNFTEGKVGKISRKE